MISLHKALFAFWSQFTLEGKALPAYVQGQVPVHTPFPYVTFSVALPTLGVATDLQATFWFMDSQNGTSANLQRAQVLTQLTHALPEEGVALSGGALFRGEPFLRYAIDAHNHRMIAAKVGVALLWWKEDEG